MRRTAEYRLIIGFCLILLVLCVNVIVSSSNMKTVSESRRLVARSREAIVAIDDLFSSIQDAETGQRGYLLTGQDVYLEPYNRALANAHQQIASLRSDTQDNPTQQHEISQLEQQMDIKFAELRTTVNLRRQHEAASALRLVMSGNGRREMQQIRGTIIGMKQIEAAQLGERTIASIAAERRTRVTFAAATVVAVLLLIIVYMLLRRSVADRDRAAASLLQLNDRLRFSITETHHRIKNNLQAVTSLLEIQKDSATDGRLSVAALNEGLLQIKTIALVHDVLSHERSMNEVNTRQILENLATLLTSTLHLTDGSAQVVLNVEDIWLPTQSATALALVVNELISNSNKHGRRVDGNNGTGDIGVRFRKTDQLLTLDVVDFGKGFPADFNVQTHANLGLALVSSLVENDLRGTIEFGTRPSDSSESNGGRVTVSFSMPPDAV